MNLGLGTCRKRKAEDTPSLQGSEGHRRAVRLGLTPGSSDNTEGTVTACTAA